MIHSNLDIISYSLGDAIDWKQEVMSATNKDCGISYSLGDAIDWKPVSFLSNNSGVFSISYSLGDAIDWKLISCESNENRFRVSYSLGDAIDWKRRGFVYFYKQPFFLLLARGRDRLETSIS